MGRFVTSPIQSQGVQFRNKQQYTSAGCYTWSTPSGVACVRLVAVGGGGSALGAGFAFNTQGGDSATGNCHTGCCAVSTLTGICQITCCPCAVKFVCCQSTNCCIVSGRICGQFIFNLQCCTNQNCTCYSSCNLCFRSYSDGCAGEGCCGRSQLCFGFSNCLFECNTAGCTGPTCKYMCIGCQCGTWSGGSGAGYADGLFPVTPGASYTVCVGSAGCTSSFGSCISATGGSASTTLTQCLKIYMDGLFYPDTFGTAVSCMRNGNCCSCSYNTGQSCWSSCCLCCTCTCTGVGCCTYCFGSTCNINVCSSGSNCDGYSASPSSYSGSLYAHMHGTFLSSASAGCGIGGSITNCGGLPITQTAYKLQMCTMVIRGCVCCTFHATPALYPQTRCHDYYFFCINCICFCGAPSTQVSGLSVNCGCVNSAPGASAGNYYGPGTSGTISPDVFVCNCCCGLFSTSANVGVVTICVSCACCPISYSCYSSAPGGTGIGGLGGTGIGGSSIPGSSSCPAACISCGCYSGYNTVGDTVHYSQLRFATSGTTQLVINPRNPNSTQWFFPEEIKGFGARVFCTSDIVYREDAGPGAGGLTGKSGVLAGASASGQPGNGGGAGLSSGTSGTGSDGLVVIYY